MLCKLCPFISRRSLEARLFSATKQDSLFGFKTSVVWPLDQDIFSEKEFLPSDVTDRPVLADPELPDINIARLRAHFSSTLSNTDTPFASDASPQGDTSINLLVLSKTPDSILNCDAVSKGGISISVLVHTVSSDAVSPEIYLQAILH
ncbi:hypothetical protein Bpfe_021697 [Biomphalaria pfeifferi]|uniref:Uncharacterized protein n=1 Tax=Biomphalaria pfeifferi TaxID=112525 RepID=A0AAD8B6I1_BIOPF|nr:hypothetical protein Bpfe_021697 [Biomphalaria pfeifferi]